MARLRDTLANVIENFERKRTVGEFEITLPKPPAIYNIANHLTRTNMQMFEYTEQPKRGEEPSEEFLRQETDRIKNGYWFFNNGNLEWITGYHYVMLNYSYIDGQRPTFNDSQQMFFWIWDFCEKDPFCFGLCLTTSRRWGKGEVAIIIGYMRTIMQEYSHFGLQSKTGDDAKLLFAKLVQRWQRFPLFLKPTDAGDTNPKQELRFFEPSKRSSKGDVKEYKPALNSWIDFKPSGNAAYDGGKLQTYVLDEAAKLEAKSDPYEMWEIVKFCLLNGSTIIGKALITTTVESGDVYEASVSYKQLWSDSNPNDRLPNGRTKSGLYRYYNAGYMGYHGIDEQTGEPFIDKYGYSRQEFTKEYILKGREGLEGNQLSSQIRKLSLTVEEAFMSDGQNCYFNSMNIQEQMTWLQEYAPKGLVRTVTFYRQGDGKVAWRSDPNGKFQMVWDFPNPSMANKSKIINRLKAPDNEIFGSTGGDPYSASEMQNGVGSKGVFYVFKKDDGSADSGLPIIRYSDRPPRKSIFYDNCMLLCEYYGIKLNMESDIQDWREYYEQQGMENYLMRTPKSAIAPDRAHKKRLFGVKSKDPYSLQAQFDATHVYFEERCHKIYFIELLQDALVYDHKNRTKSDDTVAFGISLLGSMEHVKNMREPTTLKIFHNFTQKKTTPFRLP